MKEKSKIQNEINTKIKEQRITKNNGKQFEVDFKASFEPHVWTYRPTDSGGGQNARFTIESICDLMAFDTRTRNFVLMELKSTLGTSVSFKSYEFVQNYFKEKENLENWLAGMSPAEKRKIAEQIKERKRAVRMLYKETNSAMIKYHQIRDLKEANEKFGIESYIVFKFFRTTRTFALPISTFEEFWKSTEKKSINENDLLDFVKEGKCIAIPQGYIRKTRSSVYDVSKLTLSKEEE